MDYTGLEYSYQQPQYDFPDVGGFGNFDFKVPDLQLNTPQFNFGGPDVGAGLNFSTGPLQGLSDIMGANPQMDLTATSPMAPGLPTTGMFNEGMIPHNYLSPQQAPGLTQPAQPGGLAGMFGNLGLADWLKIAGAGAPLLAGLIGAFQGPQRGVTSQTITQRPSAPPMSPYEVQALKAALLGTQAADPRLIEQAFQPQLGSLLQQAIEQARQAGFHTNPLESPVAERIMGQGLADLQGQMAAAKLGQGQYASTLGRGIASDLARTRGSDFIGGNTNATTYGNQPSYWSSLSKDLGGLLGSLGGALGTLRPSTYQQPAATGGGGLSLSGYR